ncbi:MAG TPA: hypothetical protein VFI80_08510 [Burkholderiales bacterium]|nr:hypothetical protein [Burkholderiales bacterium]
MNIDRASRPSGTRAADTCALERLPHISKRVCLLWTHPEFDAFTSHLMMDSRDGKRQGLPWDVAEEILFLAELRVVKRAIVASGITGQPFWETFNKMLANAEAAQQRLQDAAWSDPLANKDFSRIRRDEADFSRPPPELERKPRPAKRSWLGRLLG